jgi:hypothetical protein
MTDDARRQGAIDPWSAHMRRGDFATAWEISDRALAERAGRPCWHRPRHLQAIWSGEPLHGKRVLVRCYHGLGDTIQFIRYAPLLHEIAAEVIVWAQPSLLPLLASARGIDRLLPLHDGTPDIDYDVDIELMELPHAFRTTPATLPSAVPYLGVAAGPRRRSESVAVGLVWRSGDWNPRRDVPFALMARLSEVRDVELFSLQRDARPLERHERIEPLDGIDDPLGTARAMLALDLVISVDSMPAHLAGALGLRTWTLLPVDPDWRWMEGRDDSPWYPTMRLFRQRRPDDWGALIAGVATELAAFAQRAGKARARPLAEGASDLHASMAT